MSSWSPARRAAYERRRSEEKRVKADMELRFCPVCGDPKWTEETLRVHMWLAHDVHRMPSVPGPTPTR